MGLLSKIAAKFRGDEPAAEAPIELTRTDDPAKVDEVLSNQQQRDKVAAADKGKKGGFDSIVRDEEAIRNSGLLEEFAKIDTEHLEGKSEFDRTLEDDSMLVRKGLSKYTPEQLAALKESAFGDDKAVASGADPKWAKEVQSDQAAAVDDDYYGSELHREYGATVEELSGGLISAEEAMAMNPTGGIAGPGAKGVAFQDGPLRRHAVRHDAVGFLKTRFDAGPGYGTKTSAVGLQSDNPLAGQILGIAREVTNPSEQVAHDDVASSARMGGGRMPAPSVT